jgi:hypothetical protein
LGSAKQSLIAGLALFTAAFPLAYGAAKSAAPSGMVWIPGGERNSSVGRFDKALTQATQRGWVVIDMKKDWKVIFRPASPSQA